MHTPFDGTKLPELLDEEKVIVPLGELPFTLAVQVVASLAPTDKGEQKTVTGEITLLRTNEPELGA
ncbi:MAG: hypothetical protein ABSB56_05305 [Nitrososphaerales archaeon]